MTLHDELERIAAHAPVADVPDDTWARARGARRRDLALTVAGAAAALALLAGAVAWLPARLDPPVADTEGAGIPDHLYAAPQQFTTQETDLAIGRGAAAWIAESDADGVGRPLVVDAARGDYHLLDLPDYGGDNDLVARGMSPPAIALSPDGTRLAYSYAVFGADAATAPIPSGIRIVDLETGDVREIPLPGAEGTAVTSLAWSPGSNWLAWTGDRFGSWTEGSMGSPTAIAGRVGPSRTDPETRRSWDGASIAFGVDDTGRMMIVGNGRRQLWLPDGRTEGGSAPGALWSGTGVLTDDGLAIGSSDELLVTAVPTVGGPTQIAATGDLPATGGGSTQVVGTLGDRLVVRTRSLDDADGQLLLVTSDGTAEVVGTVESNVAELTVATALMTDDRPTVERDEPDWPWSDTHRAVVVGLCAALAVLSVLALRRIRRHR